ncbi:hypothetical protein HAX54_013399 [Datura stramonium]|uniref:Uncharacterized protein n=1 Tax=Datura stramonium TaxID=4076 RepID=A0ABS8S043_DATST|nr:hypothetical protein [Datura stramonium]
MILNMELKTEVVQNNATAEVSVDQYHRYKVNGTGKVNWKEVACYNRLIDYMLLRGITPYANLNHYDLPQALQDRYNGWLSREVVKDFADYAEYCVNMFGDRVKNWFSFNEPRVVAALVYDNGSFAPGRCSKPFGNCTQGDSATEPYIEKQKGQFGILLDFVWYEPLTRGKDDNHAAQRARDFHLGCMILIIPYHNPATSRTGMSDLLMIAREYQLVKGHTQIGSISCHGV